MALRNGYIRTYRLASSSRTIVDVPGDRRSRPLDDLGVSASVEKTRPDLTTTGAVRRRPGPLPEPLPDIDLTDGLPDPKVEVGSLFESLLQSCRIVPVPDPANEGLLTLTVVPGTMNMPLVQSLPIPNLIPGNTLSDSSPGLPVEVTQPPTLTLPAIVETVELSGDLTTDVTLDTTPGVPGGDTTVKATTPLDGIDVDLSAAERPLTLPDPMSATLRLPAVPLQTIADALGIELGAVWPLPPITQDGPALVPIGPLTPSGGALTGVEFLLQRFLPVPPLTTLPDTRSVTARATIGVVRVVRPLPADGIPGLVRLPELPDPVAAELPIDLPTIAVPPILILFVGRRFGNPALVVTPLDIGGHTVDALLDHFSTVLQHVERVLRLVPADLIDEIQAPLANYLPVAAALRRLTRIIGGPNVRVLASRREQNLNLFDLQLRRVNDTEAENVFSSLAYFGLPGTSVDLFVRRDFDGARLRVGVSSEMGTQGRLAFAEPGLWEVKRADPARGLLQIEPSAGLDDVVELGFGNRIGSYQFNGVNNLPLDLEMARRPVNLGF